MAPVLTSPSGLRVPGPALPAPSARSHRARLLASIVVSSSPSGLPARHECCAVQTPLGADACHSRFDTYPGRCVHPHEGAQTTAVSEKSLEEIRAAFAERRRVNLARTDDEDPDDGMPWTCEVEGTHPETGEPLTEVDVWPDGSIVVDNVTIQRLGESG